MVTAGQDVVGDGRNEAETACDVAITGNSNTRNTHQTLVMGTGFSGVENCQPAPRTRDYLSHQPVTFPRQEYVY